MGTASIAGGWCDMGRCFAASCIDKGESAMDLGRISPVRGATVSEWSSTGGTADFQRLKRTFHVRCDGKSEAIAGCFADGVNVLWQIELYDKNEILVFVAQPMS